MGLKTIVGIGDANRVHRHRRAAKRDDNKVKSDVVFGRGDGQQAADNRNNRQGCHDAAPTDTIGDVTDRPQRYQAADKEAGHEPGYGA